MADDVFYVFDYMHYLALLLGMAPYVRKLPQGSNRYEYHYDKTKLRQFTIVTVLIVLMILGSYMAVVEVRLGEESDSSTFDKVAFLYIYFEPTISGTIVLLLFTYHRKYFLKSFTLLNNITKTLESDGCTVSASIVKFRTVLFCTVFIVGNSLWNLHSYLNGKTVLHSFYEYLGWGISFHAQHIHLFYFVIHMDLSYSIANTLNNYLKILKQNKLNIFTKLSNIGHMHSELCKSVTYINKICSPTILLFSVRSYFVLCCSLMSLNGMLPKLKVDFFVLALIYVITTVQFVLCIEYLNQASVTTSKLLCELTISFYRDDVGSKRNTLLLQMLHQTTETTIYGVPLTTATLTTGFGKILTLLSFLLQLRGWSSKQQSL